MRPGGVKKKKWTARAFKFLERKRINEIVKDHSEDSQTSSAVRETLGNSAGVSTKFSPAKIAETTPQTAECENCRLLGTCILCSKGKRINYNLPERELCTCDAVAQSDLDHSSIRKDGVAERSAEKCHCGNLLKDTRSVPMMDDPGTACAVCSKDTELLCCEGKECKIRYHTSCHYPRLPDNFPGVSHCPKCASKKLELGVYSVSEGVESIWDVREVDRSNAKGKQMQYLVKYQGLAHIHNHWIPAKTLALHNQYLLSSFSTKNESWSVDWTVPYRLLRKRPIKYHTEPTADISEIYEWLVKWKGLDYGHATWELDSSHFLNSSLGQDLMTEYEIRREKAKREVEFQKGHFYELSELPSSGLDVNNRFLLKHVNKLRECWYKSQNTVVFGKQDQRMTLVFFIQSLAEFCNPFLVIASSDSLSEWEADFARLAPSVDVVVYNGNIDTRKGIRASEFYSERGPVMLQVLLSSQEAVLEDIEILSCIKWQSIVIDEYKHSGASTDLEQIKTLATDMKILLLSDQIKDTTSEYLDILSLLESEHEFNKLKGLRSGKNENLAKMKERLSRFVAYGSTSKLSKFLEYWVPVHVSNHQLEQYCSTLISQSIHLCSSSRTDKFGALRDILFKVRKCCDHPYLVDPSIRQHMIYKNHPAAEVLNVGIKACGKLQLLEIILTQIKARGLKVLVIFQSIGSGGCEIGYILCDFLVDKFGPNSYELVFGGTSPTTRKDAINRFNKGNERFILLLEKSACVSAVKISSKDAIILYNSDWNPENDFKALQKLYIDLAVDHQIKVFRLYSPCTVEERALILAKTNLNLDNDLQASSRSYIDSLLMWGASCLFSRLDDYHSERSSDSNSEQRQLLLNEVAEEFDSILSECGEISERVPRISKVKLDVASYSADIQMLGESIVQLTDVEGSHVFWKKMLDNRASPQWMHIIEESPRNHRKRVHYTGRPLVKSDARKKRRRASMEDVSQAFDQVEVQENQEIDHISGSERGTQDAVSGLRIFSPELIKCEPEERNASSDEPKSLYSSLQEEAERLCQCLELSDDVTQTLRRFLNYVILNRPICIDSPTIMQACQISLLWISAPVAKQEIDKTESLSLAKQSLHYQCTEEQVWSVYPKILDIMRTYLHSCSLITANSGADCWSDEENTNVKLNIEENSANEEQYDEVKNIQKKCDKRMKKLIQKQKQDTQEVYQIWEVKKLKLETDHKLATALIRCIYTEESKRVVKLKLVDDKLDAEMKENDLMKDVRLNALKAQQLDARNEEIKKASQWIAEVKACVSKPKHTGNIICADLPASGEDVPNETGPFEKDKEGVSSEIPENIPCGISEGVDYPEEIISASNKGCDKEDTVIFPLARQTSEEPSEQPDVDYPEEIISASSKGCDKEDTFVFPLERQILEEPSEQPEASLYCCKFLPPQVLPEDQIHQSSSSKLPDQGEPVVDDKKTSQLEVSASGALDNITVSLNKSKLQDQDAPAPVIDDHGTLQIEGTQPAQGDTIPSLEPILNQSDSHTEANLEMQHNAEPAVVTTVGDSYEAALLQLGIDLVRELSSRYSPFEDENRLQKELENIHKDTSIGVNVSNDASPGENQSTAIEVEIQSQKSGSETEVLPESDSRTGANLETQNNAEPIVGAVECSNEPILQQMGMDLGCEVASCDSPFLPSNPLQTELENIQKETSTGMNVSNNGENQSTAIEVEIQNPDFGPEAEMLAHKSDSRTGANMEMQNNVEPVVGTTVEPSNETVLNQLGTDLGREVASLDSQYLYSNPLQNELKILSKEDAELRKSLNETIFRLKSECEKKIKDAEAEYETKKAELQQSYKKVFLTKILAKCHSFLCDDLHPSGLPGIHEDFPSSFLQHTDQMLPQDSDNLQALIPAANLGSTQVIRYAPQQLQPLRPSANPGSTQVIRYAPPQLQLLRPSVNPGSTQVIRYAPLKLPVVRHSANFHSTQVITHAPPQLRQFQAHRPSVPLSIPQNSQQLVPYWNFPSTSQSRPEYQQNWPPASRAPTLHEIEQLRNGNIRPGGSFFFRPN